jgi:hypothetical protein
MNTITFFLIGDRTKELNLVNEVKDFFKTIPNFQEIYNGNDVLFIYADKDEDLKYAFGKTDYAGNEDNGDGHTSCDIWNVEVTENNSETFRNYIEIVGYEEQIDSLGEVDGYSIEGDEISRHTIEF